LQGRKTGSSPADRTGSPAKDAPPYAESGRSWRLRQCFDGGCKDVAFAAHRLDVGRLPGVVAQSLAKAADKKVYRPIEGFGLTALRQVEQLIAIEDMLRVIEKHAQQPVFGAAQRDHGLVGVDQETPGRIELPFAEPKEAGFLRCRKVAGQHLGPAQNRADSCEQLTRGKRFREIVVRPHLKADDAVCFITA